MKEKGRWIESNGCSVLVTGPQDQSLLLFFPDRFCRRHRLKTGENVPSIPRDLLLMSEMVLPRFILCIIQYLRDGYIEPGKSSYDKSFLYKDTRSQIKHQTCPIHFYFDILNRMWIPCCISKAWLNQLCMPDSSARQVFTSKPMLTVCWVWCLRTLILLHQTAQPREIYRKSCSSWNLRSPSWRSSQRWAEQWGPCWQRSWPISKRSRSCAWVNF